MLYLIHYTEAAPDFLMRNTMILLLLFLFGIGVSSACSIEEIVDMAKDGAGKTKIREACDEVDDAPKCRLSKVIDYAKADLDESEVGSKK